MINSHTLQTNKRHRDEEPRNIYIKRHMKDNKSKAISSFFLIKMITKLERTQNNAYQNEDQHRPPPQKENGGYIDNLSTTELPP